MYLVIPCQQHNGLTGGIAFDGSRTQMRQPPWPRKPEERVPSRARLLDYADPDRGSMTIHREARFVTWPQPQPHQWQLTMLVIAAVSSRIIGMK